MDKGKIIFVGVIALVGIFIVFYVISLVSGNNKGNSYGYTRVTIRTK